MFTCSRCGEAHEVRAFHAEAPVPYLMLSADEQREIAELTGEVCVIEREDGLECYIRGLIRIPVEGEDDPFEWGVWCSLSIESFKKTNELWETEGRESIAEPCFGWLCTALPESLYPSTLSLKTMVHTQPVGHRPHVVLEPTDHPLAVEQREGISQARLQEILEACLHG